MKININKNNIKASIIILIVLLSICFIGFKYDQKDTNNIIGFIATIFVSFFVSFLNILKIEFKEKNIKWINKIVALITIFTAFIMAELLNSINMFKIDIKLIMFNIALITTIYLVFAVFTSKAKIVIITSNVIIFLLTFTNFLVIKFRGTPFVPWDILSIGTAATVVGKYSFSITPLIVLSVLILITNIVIALKLKSEKITAKEKIFTSIFSLAISFSFLFVFLSTDIIINYFNITNDFWDTVQDYKEKGIVLSFFIKSRDFLKKEPEGYSIEKINSILEEIDTVNVSANIKEPEEQLKPNIVVIMNESLADLRVIEDFKISEEVFPFLYSLKENTIKGNLHVSVFGGNTCNTEWEFLTR